MTGKKRKAAAKKPVAKKTAAGKTIRTKKKSKFVLIDGAAGFLGGHLVETFIQRGYRVRATDLPGTDMAKVRKSGAEVITSDLLDVDSLQKVCKDIDWVVHSAAAFDLGLPYPVLERVNVKGTDNLCRVIVSQRIEKLLHVSTAGVYGPPIKTPTTEDHPFNPTDSYSISKYIAEKVVERYRNEYGLHTAMFRPTALYGPRSIYIASAFIALPIIAREKGLKSLPMLNAGQRLNMIHVMDVANAAAHVLEQKNIPSGEAYNLADCDIMTVIDFLEIFYRAFGINKGRRISIPSRIFDISLNFSGKLASERALAPVNRWLGRTWREIVDKYGLEPALSPHLNRDDLFYFAGNHAYDNTKLLDTGYRFLYPSFKEGFDETVIWYQKNRWIPSFE